MTYQVIVRPRASNAIRGLPRKIQGQLLRKIESLGNNPRPGGYQPLKGFPGCFHVRSGDYRIIYCIKDEELIVVVVRVGNRREVYCDL